MSKPNISRGSLIAAAIALAATGAAVFLLTRGISGPADSEKPETPPQASPALRFHAVRVTTPVPPGNRNVGESPRSDQWSTAPVLASDTLASPDGRLLSEVRIVKSGMKHPLLRIENTHLIDASGRRSLRAQIAMAADHFLVKLKPGVTEDRLRTFAANHNITIRERKPLSGIYILAIPDGAILEALPGALALFASPSSPASVAEPDYIYKAQALPNDPQYNSLWGLNNTGQNGGTADADIDAPEAWDKTTGSPNVLVAAIDTGIDQDHPDLVENLWVNPNEIASNNIDDDNNGYVDDTHGWDFYNADNNPDDDNNHGTHTAGAIGARGNNAVGVTGVCWSVKLAALKFLNAAASGYTSDAVEAVVYATSIGADITSNSWGGGGASSLLEAAIKDANEADVLFVAAAGNDGTNNDSLPNYPANYDIDNVISVAASTTTDTRASFSNYGAATVDIAAPGTYILSTIRGGAYATMQGTSMATPHVSGACALLKAFKPSLSAAEIKLVLLASVDPLPAFADIVSSGGRLNVNKALDNANRVLLTPAKDLIAEGSAGGPFTPSSRTYTLKNLKTTTGSWTFDSSLPWVSASPAQGAIPAGGTATVTVSLNSAANSLAPGFHEAQWTIRDATGPIASRLAVLTVVSPPIVSFDLGSSPGWTTQGAWTFGPPTGQGGSNYGYPDPLAGATGPNVYGVNLNGDYSTVIGGPYFLTTPAIDLASWKNTKLRFKRWLNTDYTPYVYATVEISTSGSSWTTLWTNPNNVFIEDSAWTTQTFDLAAYADGKSTVYLRWGHRVGSSGAYPYSGWNIDDIQILGEPSEPITISEFRAKAGLAADGSQDGLAPAGDGVSNIFKFAFNMIGSGSGQQPSLDLPNNVILQDGVLSGLPHIDFDEGGPLRVTYIRRKASTNPGVTYTVEFLDSIDTPGWGQNISAIETATSLDGLFERVVVTDTAPPSNSTRYARVKVE